MILLLMMTLSVSLTASWKVEIENGTEVTTLNILLLQGMDEIRNESLNLAKMAESSLRQEGKLPDEIKFKYIFIFPKMMMKYRTKE